jgi:putative MATE family efflux protein
MIAANTYKNIWKISLPIILSGVAQNIVNVTDTAFLGQVGEIELGAAGNAGIFYFVLALVGMGFTIGSQIVIGRRNGAGRLSEIGTIVDHTFIFVIALGVFIFGILQLLAPMFFASIVSSEAILDASVKFIQVRSYGIVFAFINFAFMAFFVGITKTKVLTYATLIMCLVNVLLDYLLIFGNHGFPKMGVEGAALASVIAEIATCIFYGIYLKKTIKNNEYHLFKIKRFDKTLITSMLSISWPIMLQNFMSISSWFVFFMIIEKMGESELAVSHIIRSIYMVLMIPLFGFSNATNTLVSNYIGAGRHSEVTNLIGKITVLSLLCTLVAVQVNLFFPYEVISLYTNNPLIIASTYDTLQVINFSMFFFCTAYIVFSGVTGTGNTKVSLLIESINITIYISAAFIIVNYFSPTIDQVWYSEFIYFTFLGLMSLWYLKSGKWKKLVV